MIISVYSVVATVVEVLLAAVVTGVIYYIWSLQYWKSRNVPYVTPKISRMLHYLLIKHLGIYFQYIYKELKKKGTKHGGGLYGLTSPKYMIMDPETIKHVVQNDFHNFTDRGLYYNTKDDFLSENLAFIGGDRWHEVRTKLSPAFTPAKIKMMLEIFLKNASHMIEAVDKICDSNKPVNLKEVADGYEIDVVGSCMFGMECNSFKYPDAEFRVEGKRIFEKIGVARYFKIMLSFMYKGFGELFQIKMFKEESAKFFLGVIKEAVAFRKKNHYVAKDMLQLLIDMDNNTKNGKGNEDADIREITAHAFALFVGGYETSAAIITFCLYELAQQLDIQQKVRDDIERVLAQYDGKVTYDAIGNMKYFNQVYDETLRKYPAVSYYCRETSNDYKIPNSDVVLEKGIICIISLLGLHYDTDYYPDPEKFDPDRFSDENRRARHPFAYLPFGDGPRNCIGYRFGLFSTKVALVLFIKNYEFTLNERTKVPMQFCPRTFTLTPKEDVFVNAKRIASHDHLLD